MKRRVLWSAALAVAVLVPTLIGLLHVQMVRRAALSRLADLSGKSLGIALQAKDLDYNLFSRWFTLEKISLRDITARDLSPFLSADRIRIRLRYSSLLRGSFAADDLRVEGLRLQGMIGKDGRGNLPLELLESTGSNDLRLPVASIEISGFSLEYDDERTGLSVRLPSASLNAGTLQPGGTQEVRCALLTRGAVRLDGKTVPIDMLKLDAVLEAKQATIRALQLRSADSTIRAQGVYSSVDVPRLDLSVEGNLDSSTLTPWLGLTEPLAGRIQAKVTVSGEPARPAVEGELSSDALKLGAFRWNFVSTRVRLDPAAGILEWKNLKAGMFAGQLAAGGRLALKGQAPSSLTAELKEFDLRQLPAVKGSPALPAGRASVQMTATCPGLHWDRLQVKASAAVRLNPEQRRGGRSTISGEFDGRLQDRRLLVHIGSISGHGANLQGSVIIGTGDQSLAGDLTGTVRSASDLIHALESDLGKPADSLIPFPVDGALELRVALFGSLRDPGASVELTGIGMSAGRIDDAKLQVRGEYAGSAFHVDQARLDWRNQTATAAGEFGLDSDSAPLRFEASAENASVGEILQGLGLKVDVQGTADARVSVTGTMGEPRMHIRVDGRDVTAYGEPVGILSAEADWHGGALEVSRLRTELPQAAGKGMLEGRGTCNFDTRAYEFSLTGKDLRPTSLRLPGDTPVQGTLQLTAQGTGSLDNPAIRAEAEWADLQVAGYTFGAARAHLDVSDHRARLKVEGTTFGATASGEVALDQEYPFRFEISTPPSASAIAKDGDTLATIAIAATIRGEGRLSPPELRQASALLKDFRLAKGEAEIHSEGPVDIRYADGRLALQPAVFVSGESRLELYGSLPLEAASEPGEISLAGKINLASILSIFSAAGDYEVTGAASLESRQRGSLRGLTGSSVLRLEGGRIRHKALPGTLEDLQAEVSMRDGRIKVDQATARVGSGTIRASGDMPLDFLTQTAKTSVSPSPAPARFSLEMRKVPVSSLIALPDLTSGEFSLTFAGEAGSPAVEAIDARLELGEFSIRRESASIQTSEPSILRIRNGQIRIERSLWKSTHGELQLAGSLGLTGDYPLDVTLSGKGDASIISMISPTILSSGALRLDLRSSGALRNPLFTGTVELEKGSIGVRQPRLVAEDLEFSAAIDGHRIDIRKFSGVLNGGRLQGGGSASFDQGKLNSVQIDLRGQDVFLEYPAGMKTALDLDIQARSKDTTVVIGGEMSIREGSYLDPFNFSQARSEGEELGRKTESSGKRLELLGSKFVYDIGVRTRQPIVIDNNLARLSAKVDVRLVGDVGRPGMRGAVTIDRGGKVYFGGRTYDTERGVVAFASDTRLDPLFDVVGTTRVNDYLVTLRLGGTGSEITTTFTSDPPLSQNDVVALLLTGQPSSESGGRGMDSAQAEKMSLLAGALNADLSGRMRRRFGVSQVMIQPGLVTEESDPGTRLTVGQNLSDSLQLVYSMNLANSGDQLWYLEYDLHRRFTARAVKQSDNTYRTDFQQDLRFGGQRAGANALSSGAVKLKVGKVEFTGNPVFPSSQLAKEFKVGPGSKFSFAESHKSIGRLTKFYAKRDYLETRIQMDREEEGDRVNLTLQIEAGQPVRFAYTGTGASRSVSKLVRAIWQEGIADRQRLNEVEDRLRLHFAKQGYLQAKAAGKVTTRTGEKEVEVDLQPGPRFRQVQTVFEGATPEHAEAMAARIRQRKLADHIYLEPRRVAEDLAAYYRQQGRYLAKVDLPRFDLDPSRGTARIVFPVAEGPEILVGTVEFEGNKNLTASQLTEKLPLAKGKVLDPDLVRRSVAEISDRYGRAGFRDPDIEPRLELNEKESAVSVTFSIQEGVRTNVRSLEVSGQNRVSEKYVREQLRISENEPQNFPQTSQSIANLYNTGAFASVSIESTVDKSTAAAGSETETVDLAVKVQEVSPYKIRYGGYLDSGRGPGVIFDVENRNSLGNARVLGLRTRYDKDLQEARLYLTQPLWRQRLRPTTGTLFFRRENDYYEGLSAQRVGFTIQQEAVFKKRLVLSYGYRFEDVLTWYPDQRASNRAIVTPLTLTLTRNTRDDFLDPARGSFISTALEYAPGFWGENTKYTRFFGQVFKYFPLFKPGFTPFQGETKRPRTIFATGARVGLIRSGSDQPVIATERFYAGGGTTVRGFEQDTLGPLNKYGEPLGGNAMLVLNNELRFPAVSIFDGVGFVDIGNVFPNVSDFKLSELRKTAGFGLRFRLPGLMLRFDYGFKLDRRPGESRGAFFFSIGQAY